MTAAYEIRKVDDGGLYLMIRDDEDASNFDAYRLSTQHNLDDDHIVTIDDALTRCCVFDEALGIDTLNVLLPLGSGRTRQGSTFQGSAHSDLKTSTW